MAKLALLLGVSGSGKTHHVTDRLKSSPQILTVDLIRTEAIHALCTASELESHDIHRWPIWDTLLKRSDAHAGICTGIRKRNPDLNLDKDTLAEGGMLAHNGFRHAFLQSLKQLGFKADQIVTFWLDPNADAVLNNVLKRGRDSQKDYTKQNAVDAVNWYRNQAKGLDCRRISVAANAVLQIDSYFAP